MVKNKRKNKKKNSKKSANNESEIPEPCTSNTSDVITDGKQFTKGNNRSTDDVQVAVQSTQNAAEEKDKKSSCRSTDDIVAALQHSLESDLVLFCIVNSIIECKKSVNFPEMAHMRNEDLHLSCTIVSGNYECTRRDKSTLEKLLCILNKRLADRDPDFVKFVMEYINKQSYFSYLQEQVSSAAGMVTLAGAGVYEEIRKSKEQVDINAHVTMATAEMKYGRNEARLDLETEEMKSKEQGDANAQVTMATAKMEYGTEKWKKQMGGCDISADDIENPAYTPHNVESKNDGNNNKGSNRCTEDGQSKSDCIPNVTGEMEGKKSMNRSPENNPVVDQISQDMDLGFDDEVICRALRKIMIDIDKKLHKIAHSENISKPLSSRERKSRLDSIAKRHLESNAFLMSQNPKLAKHAEKYMDIQSELTHLKRLRNLQRSSAEEAVTTATKAEIQVETKDSKEQEDNANEQVTTTAAELENEPKKLEKVEEKKDANESIRCIDDSEKSAHSQHHFIIQKQGKKDKGSKSSADNIQLTEHSSQSQKLDHDDKTLTKTIDNNEEKETDIPGVEHSNKREKAQNKPEALDGIQHGLKEVLKPEDSKLDKYAKTLIYAETALNILKQKQAANASKGETDVYRRSSIEAASVANELIKQFEKAEIEKIVKKDGEKEHLTGDFREASHSPGNSPSRKKDTKDSNKSKIDSGDSQTAGQSPKNVIQGRKEGNKGTKYIIKSTSDLQVDDYPHFDIDKSMSTFQTIYEKIYKPKNMAQKISPQKTKKKAKSGEKFRRDLKGFLKLQNSKLDEQMAESSVVKSDLKLFNEQRVSNELIKQLEKAEIENIVKKDAENLTGDFLEASASPGNAQCRKKDTKDSNKSKMDSGVTQTDGQSPKNVTEGRKEENKGRKYIIKSTSDLQVDDYPDFDIDKSMSTFETIYPKNMAQKISPQKTKKKAKSGEKFRRDLKGFLKLQNSKLDEQMAESSIVKSDLKLSKEQRDKISTEKKRATSTAEAQFETVITPESKDNAIEDSTAFDVNKEIVRLDKNQEIKFWINRNGFKTFNLSSENIFHHYLKSHHFTYELKHEKVQVSFIGDQILVRTQNSEFDISVLKPEPVDLKDDATQTDDKP